MAENGPGPLERAFAGAAAKVFAGIMPDPGKGWAPGDLTIFPTYGEDNVWWIRDRNGRVLDILDADPFGSTRELAKHLLELNELAGTDAAELDVEQPETSDRGVQ